MLVNIAQHFIEQGRTWLVGESVDVPTEVAQRWIADGKATADADGRRDQSSVSGDGAISPPAPAATPAATHAALAAFFDAAPAGARITFPAAAVYEVYGGVIRHKPGQVVDYSGSTIKRAPEVVATTTAPIVYGSSIVIPVSSTAGFLVGQAVGASGTRSGGNAVVMWSARITSVGAGSITVENTAEFIDLVAQGYTTANILTGATIKTAGTLVDAATLMAADSWHKTMNLVVDGNKANNASINRWEYCCEVKSYGSCEVRDVHLRDSCGEGLIVWGEGPRVIGFRAENINGNGVHLNSGCYDAVVRDVHIDTCCLVDIGHSDGGIAASSLVRRSVVENWFIKNSRRGAVASWDAAINSWAKISNGYAESCWDGLRCSAPGEAMTDIEIRDVTLNNCGPSLIGVERTSVSQTADGARWNIRNLRLIDSLAMFSGLADSYVEVYCNHTDSATNTSTTTAAGRATNYVGYRLSALNALVTFTACRRSRLIANVVDGATAPLASTRNISFNSAPGGPMMACSLDFRTEGGLTGIASQASVVVGCSGRLAAKNWKSGDTGVRLDFTSRSVDAAFVAGTEASRDNIFELELEYSRSSAATDTIGIRCNNNNGGSTVTGWLELSGSIRFVTSASGSFGFVANSGAPRTTLLTNLRVVGPASGFTPWLLNAAGTAGHARVRGCASYPAPAALPSNWVADDGGIVTLPAV